MNFCAGNIGSCKPAFDTAGKQCIPMHRIPDFTVHSQCTPTMVHTVVSDFLMCYSIRAVADTSWGVAYANVAMAGRRRLRPSATRGLGAACDSFALEDEMGTWTGTACPPRPAADLLADTHCWSFGHHSSAIDQLPPCPPADRTLVILLASSLLPHLYGANGTGKEVTADKAWLVSERPARRT